ncbi:hypothetical protein [Kutzneria sp. NPDC051319]|uniref:hypothetical protein n=1 Tax=Kutzneria sp. NPDC051319 TaxID=3155047 RepID=UPI0034491843
MSTTAIVIVVVVVVVLLAAGLAARPYLKRRQLQAKFGPEYDHLVRDKGDRRTAEQELEERQRRHEKFELRPLTEESREGYLRDWAWAQEQFVDSPRGAVRRADELVGQIMRDRGYPVEGTEQQIADLSVEHSKVLGNYRIAHDISSRGDDDPPSTEDLRNAMRHYRTLVEDLLDHATTERSK